MNPKLFSILATLSAHIVGGAMLLPQASLAQGADVEDVQYLTRGPVHEAFADSVSFDPVAGIIIAGAVPEPIEEMPPEQQPEGDNVTWIPGYWAWDDDENDFIWISGIWRNLPPDREWVPGYWSEIEDNQSQWTSGYWADSAQETVSYIQTQPPKNIDVGPNIAAPSADHNWIPGNWMWTDDRYAWRPGYWVPQRQNWTWVPSRYNWSHRGYVHIDGYWDHAVARRGVLFAPVRYRNQYYSTPNYYHTPSIVVALNVFSDHLFVRPRSNHYYFGDYYAPRYQQAGIFASFSWHSGGRGYDPIYAHDRWSHRGDQGWDRRRVENYNYFRDHENARPAHTWAAMRDYRDDRFNDGRNRTYATPFDRFASDSKSGQRFRKVDEGRRKQFVEQGREMRKFSQERRQLEARGNRAEVAGNAIKQSESRERVARRSPIVGRQAKQLAKNEAPPERPEARSSQARANAGKNQPKADLARKDDGRGTANRPNANRPGTGTDQKREPGTRAETRPGNANNRNDDKAAKPGMNRDEKPGLRTAPGQNKAEPGKAAPERKAPDKKAEPKSQVRPDKTKPPVRETPRRVEQPKAKETPAPKAKPQATPKRETKPQPKAEPRKASPREKPAKAQNRPTPSRKPEATPKRESKPEPRKASPREAPKTQSRPAPSRKPEAAPKRESRPAAKPEARRETRAQPQQAAPQRKAAESRKENRKTEAEDSNKNRSGKGN